MHQEVGAGCPGSLDGLPELLVSELKLTQTHEDTCRDKDTKTQADTNVRSYTRTLLACCLCFYARQPQRIIYKKRRLGQCQELFDFAAFSTE